MIVLFAQNDSTFYSEASMIFVKYCISDCYKGLMKSSQKSYIWARIKVD